MKRPRTPRPAALAILAIGALTLSACSGTNADAQAPQSFDGATATVTKGDLVGETTVQGTLHYADSYTLKSAFEGVVGNSVTVRLPGSATTTTGTITSVEPPREKAGEEGSKETTKERIIPITVTPDDTSALEGLQEASVSLGLTSETRTGVLSVPLGALVALSTDQFGVEVVDEKGEIRRVPVTVGLFAGDRVEVSGDEIAEGQRVVVPNR